MMKKKKKIKVRKVEKKMNKKMREIRAQIEVLNEEATKCYESKDLVGAENKLAEIEDLEREYKVAAKLFKTEKGTVDDTIVTQVKSNDKMKNFADAIRKIRNTMSEGTATEGGYTVPEDVSTDIERLREAKFNLAQLVSVETVNTMSGSRTYKKRSSQTGFSKVGEGKTIGSKNTPQFSHAQRVLQPSLHQTKLFSLLGVNPLKLGSSSNAPNSINWSKIASFPLQQARCIALSPFRFVRSTFAPFCSRSVTASLQWSVAAMMSAVAPSR